MAKKRKEVWVACSNCGGKTKKHMVQRTFESEFSDEDGGYWESHTYQICQCGGCEQVRFRVVSSSSVEIGEYTHDPVETVRIYPEFRSSSRASVDASSFPEQIQQIYRETVAAFNAGINTLAGGGIRAIVEGICKDQNAGGKNLLLKIDELVKRELLARPQAVFLHEARYIGNVALHELQQPSVQAIQDGLDIVESLLNTIYVLPVKADRLKKGRTAKKPPMTPPKQFRLRRHLLLKSSTEKDKSNG